MLGITLIALHVFYLILKNDNRKSKVLQLSSLYTWGNWSIEHLHTFAKITQVVSGGEGHRIWTQSSPRVHALNHYHRIWPDSAPSQVTGSISLSSPSSYSPSRNLIPKHRTHAFLCISTDIKRVSSPLPVSTTNRGILCVIIQQISTECL